MVTLLQGNKSGTGFRAYSLTDAGVPNQPQDADL